MSTLRTSKAKEQILGKIRAGLAAAKLPMPFPEADREAPDFYAGTDLMPEEKFASEFIKLGGRFVYCDNEQELLEGLAGLFDSQGWTQLLCTEKDIIAKAQALGINLITPADASLDKADACITGCESLIARTGSVILSSKQPMGRIGPVFFPVHIIVAYSNQVVDDIGDGLDQIHSKYGAAMPSLINLNTGPSRTADIEKTLVVGVHGPKEVFCFLVNRQ